MADKHFNNQGWNLEESIQERSSNNATPISAQKSLERSKARGFLMSVPVPVDSSTTHTEIN